jgi:hypothetical protein
MTGEFPVGAYFGRGTPNTASLLPIMWKEMGRKMLYTSEVCFLEFHLCACSSYFEQGLQ